MVPYSAYYTDDKALWIVEPACYSQYIYKHMWIRIANRKPPGPISTRRVLVTSMLVDLLDFLMNTAVAVFTGSVVMVVEAMQGLADLSSTGMLLLGYNRSRRHANKRHPFGYGKEMYFWSVLAAFIIVAITATTSFLMGLREFRNPTPVDNIGAAWVILAIAIVTNAYAFFLGARKLLNGQRFSKLMSAFMNSPMIATKTTVVLDAMGTMAAMFGLSSLVAYGVRHNPYLDGIGAMIMAVVLAVFAIILLVSARSLVTGQSAPEELEGMIKDATLKVPGVQAVLGLSTMMLGAESTLVNIEVHIRDNLTTDEVEEIIEHIKHNVHKLQHGMKVHVEPDAH